MTEKDKATLSEAIQIVADIQYILMAVTLMKPESMPLIIKTFEDFAKDNGLEMPTH